MRELVADVVALLDATGVERAHVVGHDWGGAVAWALASDHADRVATLTVLSTPHPRAMAQSLRSSDQAVRSSYIGLFQLPVVPEALLLARGGALLRRLLRRSGLPTAEAEAYAARQAEPGALTASLGWYRALPLDGSPSGDVAVPTRYLWGDRDGALGERAAELTAEHVTGPYRFERLEGASHWLPELHAELVAAAILDHRRDGGDPAGAPST
jgi:pimeloyl-ACP methyl ester carboxylesterase